MKLYNDLSKVEICLKFEWESLWMDVVLVHFNVFLRIFCVFYFLK